MKSIYIFIFLVIMGLVSCEDMKYAELASDIAPVSNLKAVQSNNSNDILVSWTAPSGIDVYNALLNYDGSINSLKNNPIGDTIFNPIVNVEHAITIKVNTPDGKVSEGVTTRITIDGPNPVSDFTGTRDGDSIILAWTLSSENTASEIEISYGDQVVTVPATTTTYTIRNVVATQKYIFGIRTKTAGTSSNYVYATVNSVKYAYLTYFKSLEDLQQNGNNEEVAAANWFVATYPSGDIISTSDIKNDVVSLSQYSVIWINVDNTITAALPAELKNSDVLSRITSYYKNGGSLLLTTFATQYVVDLGRTSRKPGILGAGSAAFNADIWDANIIIGADQPAKYNYTNHPLFAGLDMDNSSFSYPAVPLIGSGLKENHNSMWDLNSYGYQIPKDGDNVVRAFEIENKAMVMATWGQVTDYCCGGIIYFTPTTAYQGKCIAIGLAAYEFNQSSGVPPYTCTNVYQKNIEKLTQNAISILQ